MQTAKCACKGDFLDKFIQPSILTILHEEPTYGFEIYRKLIDSQLIAGNSIDPTGMYRTLKKMEAQGLLSSHWDLNDNSSQPRRIYAITDGGKSCLKQWEATLSDYRDTINLLLYKIMSLNLDEELLQSKLDGKDSAGTATYCCPSTKTVAE